MARGRRSRPAVEEGPTALRGHALTAYERIAQDLRKAILDKRLAVGTRIGSESELCERWKASRTTVRRALLELASEELLVSHQGAGWFVSEPRVQQQLAQLEPLNDILPRYGDTAHKVTSFRFIHPPPSVAHALSLKSDSSTILEIERVHSLKGEPLALIRIWLVDWIGSQLSLDDANAGTIFPALPGRTGIRVDYSSQTIRASGAGSRDAELLHVKPGAHVLQVDRISYTTDGVAFAVTQILYRADRFELRMSLKWRDADTWQAVIAPGVGLTEELESPAPNRAAVKTRRRPSG